MRRILAVLIFVAAGACVACDPPPPEPEFPVQTPNTIHLEGDSVTFQTYYNSGVPTFHTSGEFVPGSSASQSWSGVPATVRVPQMVAQGRVDTLVWALGLNEIYLDPNHQWSPKDQSIWLDMFMNKIPAETCLVIVKPWVLPAGNDVRPLQSMNALRGWIDAMAEVRPNTVSVDWKPIVETNPQYAAPDGAHIDPAAGGAVARDAMYREGVERCA